MSLPTPWKPPASTRSAGEDHTGQPGASPAAPRALLGGAVLLLLLGGWIAFKGYAGYRSSAAPVPVVITHQPPAAQIASPPRRKPVSAAPPTTAAATASAAGEAAHAATEIAEPIMVHMVGAVRKPGVYRLPPRARLVDAVHAAGGPKAGADLEAVNLASFVQDGEQIRVPSLAERRAPRLIDAARPRVSHLSQAAPPRPIRSTARYPIAAATTAEATAAAAPEASRSGKKDGGPVNINTAGEEELRTLPGVGPKTAAAILAYRQEHGPFQRPEDLMEIRGIGEKKLARMRDRVVVK